MADAPRPAPLRCGTIALIGTPNAGKSTLVNSLIGQKLAIVSPKVQTTRTRLLGIAVAGAAQLLLFDTPGLFAPKRAIDRAMVSDAREVARDADIRLLLVDAARPAMPDAVGEVSSEAAPTWLVLNKIDLVAKEKLLPLAARLANEAAFKQVFMVSALTGDGVTDLREALAEAVPEGPWLYPEDQLTDAPARLVATELTREQLFLQLGQELPYAAAVLPESFETRPDGSLHIRQQILVERDSQKAIVLGRGGARIRAIGEAARAAIGEALGAPVHLFLHVKVAPGWPEDARMLRALGLAGPHRT
ncbi:GTPase Era [Thermaurantiacus sp.]